MNRQDILDFLDEIEFFPEKREEVFSYLQDFICSLDLEVVGKLLEAGASPQAKDNLSDYLYYLLNEYQNTHTLHGDRILLLMEMLLKAGANPDGIWCNNWRAYDYAVAYEISEIIELLKKYGASQVGRQKI